MTSGSIKLKKQVLFFQDRFQGDILQKFVNTLEKCKEQRVDNEGINREVCASTLPMLFIVLHDLFSSISLSFT